MKVSAINRDGGVLYRKGAAGKQGVQKFNNPKDCVSFTGSAALRPQDVTIFTDFLSPVYQSLSSELAPSGVLPVEQADTSKVKDILKKSDTKHFKVEGVGTNSVCYRLTTPDNRVFGIKFYRPDAKNYGNDRAYEKEAFALKRVKELGIDDAQELIGVFNKNGQHFIVTNLATGQPLNAKESRFLNPEQSEDLLKKLFKLDKGGFIQFDLQSDNIYFDGNKAQLIDFGGFSTAIKDKATFENLLNMGLPLDYNSFYPSFTSIPEIGGIAQFDLENAVKSDFPYLGFSDIKTSGAIQNANPYFSGLSNTANFEYRTLFPHLTDALDSGKDPKDVREIFSAFLNKRAEFYHKPMSETFLSLDVKKAATACQIDEAAMADRIKNAAAHEKLMSEILSGTINENVLKTEVAKMQIRWVARENPDSFKSQADKLTSMIEGFRSGVSGDEKQYYDDVLLFFEKLKSSAPKVANDVELPSDKNLLERLFGFAKTVTTPLQQPAAAQKELPKAAQQKAKEAAKPVEEAVQTAKEEIKETAKTHSKILPVFLGLTAIAAVAGGFAAYEKHKLSKAQETAQTLQKPETPQPSTVPVTDYSTNAIKQDNPTPTKPSTQLKPLGMNEFMKSVK